jgi:tRNA1(Val) A37 N6-methylase TrmN6
MKTTSGRANEMDKKNIARHEVCGDIKDFTLAAKRILKYGGTFAAVYRPDRLVDLIVAMREAKIEPKRITFVHADTESESSMVLIEGKAGGKSGAILTRPLIIYKEKNHSEYTEDMKYIMENGSFPEGYRR